MTNEELVREIKQGKNTKENTEKLYLQNRNMIYKIASRYKHYEDVDDLLQEGFFGLCNAIQPYDEKQGYLFLTYATHHIRQAIHRYIENNGKTVRIPTYLIGLTKKYKKVENVFKLKENRKPADDELCRALNISFETLENVRGVTYHFDNMESLNNEIRGLESENLTIGDCVADDINLEDDVVDSIMDHKIKTELWEIVERETNDIENKVINGRFKKSLSLNDVGIELGITKEAVRQWEGKALRKLRRSRVTREIKEKFEINMARAYVCSLSGFRSTWTSSTERLAIINLELSQQLEECKNISM